MENDPTIPKLTWRQKLQIFFLVLVLTGLMTVMIVKLIGLIGMWMNVHEPLKSKCYDHPSHVLAGAFLLLAFVQTDHRI